MPVYEYVCPNKCNGDEHIIKQRSIKENDPGYDCEQCSSQLTRVYSQVGALFTGSGFYSTDNRK